MCKVSIILPDFNRKHCIGKAVDSVIRQTWQDSISNDAAGHIRNSFYILGKHRTLFEEHDMVLPYLNQLAEYAMGYCQLELYMECLQSQFGMVK